MAVVLAGRVVVVRVDEALAAPGAVRLVVAVLVGTPVFRGGFRAAAVELAVLIVRDFPGLDMIELVRREGVVFFSSSLALTLGRLR